MTKKKETIISVALIAALLIVLYVLEQILPSTSMLFTVLKKGAIYALVAVSMNLLNGFTGLFSLGQAGLCFWVPIPMESLPFRWNREKMYICILTAVLYSLLCRFLLH